MTTNQPHEPSKELHAGTVAHSQGKPTGASQPRTRSIRRNEQGLSTVEYLIILALVAVAGIGSWKSFGGAVKDKLSDGAETINTAETNANMNPNKKGR